jgi:hypothetical protein
MATVHGTQKPVECMRRPMLNNSEPGDAVYEPFLGQAFLRPFKSGRGFVWCLPLRAGEQAGRRRQRLRLIAGGVTEIGTAHRRGREAWARGLLARGMVPMFLLLPQVFDGAGNVREDIASDVLASITTMQWNGPAKGWNAGAPMDDANFNRRQTIRVGAAVAYAQVGVIGFDGPIDLQSLRLYGLPEAAPAVLNGTPLLTGALFGSGRREFAAEVSWDLPSLAPGATSLLDVTVNGARAGDLVQASLVSSTRFIELDAAVWSNNTVRVMARNISAATFDLAAATLSVGVAKRRVP